MSGPARTENTDTTSIVAIANNLFIMIKKIVKLLYRHMKFSYSGANVGAKIADLQKIGLNRALCKILTINIL